MAKRVSPVKFVKLSIPEATDRESILLAVVASAHKAIVVIQVAVPCVVRIILCSTPPDTVPKNAVERANAAATTTRETCKTATVSAVAV